MALRGRISLRMLRYWLAGAMVALLLVVTGLIGYARWKVHRLMGELPARLGVRITEESDNVTYSQSYRGRTVYTVHAKKQIEQKDGRYTLKDVEIVLYGAKGDRSDRIHGNEFEYDQKNGTLHAVGQVFLDLGGPGPAAAGARGEDAGRRMIHVKTSGVTFLQKERSAATDEEVEFTAGAMSGKAMGASYDSGSGVVVLKSAVRMSGLRAGGGGALGGGGEARPMVVTATRAEMDRVPAEEAEARGAAAIGLAAAGNGSVVRLEQARVISEGEHGEQTMAAQHALVRVTEDGAPTRVDAEGQVTLTTHGSGGVESKVWGQRLTVKLNPAGQPADAQLAEDVRFAEDAPGRQARGQAAEARMAFDAEGRPVRAAMSGGVVLDDTATAGEQRRLEAERLELELGGGGRQPVTVRRAVASGKDGAKLRMAGAPVKGRVEETAVRADVLTARMAAGSKRAELSGLDGTGRTEVRQAVRDGAGVLLDQTSSGRELRVEFDLSAQTRRQQIARAEQRGGVTVVRQERGKSGMETTKARGETAVYEAAQDRLVMTGGAQVAGAGGELSADRVELARGSGDATAEGEVKATYAQASADGEAGGEPVHVLAAKAVTNRASGVTEFTAGEGVVKMWQGGSQVEARVIDLDRTKKVMVARGEGGARAVIAETGKKGGVVRAASREMTYADAARTISLRGGVTLKNVDGTMRADAATVYLVPAAVRPGKTVAFPGGGGLPGGGLPEGKVERIVGVGGVEVVQPGRTATGDRLVYTAADATFVLTGIRGAPPRLMDAQQGTLTGSVVKFTSGEDSVVVESGDGRRVTTELRVKQ